jgi:DNA-binding PadR family transcriptional regulator
MYKAFAFGIPVGGENFCGGHRARWGFGGFDGWASEFWGARGRHHRGRMGRIFEQGDLKYVILRLLEEKPRHGYEIIKELEDRFGGAYSPSPGTVYPTLTMLEDLGYAKASTDEGGRKVYSVTPEGSAYLAEHSTTVDSIFERITRFVEGFLDAPMMEVNNAFRHVGRATYSHASRNVNDAAKLQRVKEILERAAHELEALDKPDG